MAVYTPLSTEQVREFLNHYDLGELVAFQGIAEGVENSNFLLQTTRGRFILTLFERRMDPAELPWFLELMGRLSARGLSCPQPIADRTGRTLSQLAGKPGVIVSFLPGSSQAHPDVWACRAVGRALAELHEAGKGMGARANRLGPEAWPVLLEACGDGKGGESPEISTLQAEAGQALSRLLPAWPKPEALPRGQIHADLFPDNVFFLSGADARRLSGVIDFYFACTDFLAYDLAIVLNAWCFEEVGPAERQSVAVPGARVIFSPEKAAAVLEGYESLRPLEPAERAALPVLCQGAAMRFLLTRLYDWTHTPPDAQVTRKDPWAYAERLRHFMRLSPQVFSQPVGTTLKDGGGRGVKA
ncbi:homoserine kinase [Oecophyllibacter saccharovorans]|uniref:homoserine kinase n=1 Tax=Oecophyllibacter saccharovorans TaxID=2558360 RepID=UPI001144BE3A|nr:homoserine kinase [Oecophyllibacter saccharovorans]QDH14688.1 homoserine kinase [Oecophyllibacter saccharovorans]